MTLMQSLILGVIEGITEFLPISSTGHMVITSSLLNMEPTPFLKAFEVIIQSGAIFAVLIIYWKRFLSSWGFYKKLFVAFLPTAIIGFAVKNYVELMLGSTAVVAWALIFGGVILIASDKFFAHLQNEGSTTDQLTYKNSFILGLAQCVALIPGISRSGATIIGGLSLGMNKKEAAEFSFFLAVPTMAAATAYKLIKIRNDIDASQLNILAFGWIVSFVVAIAAIKIFIEIVGRYGFRYFGYYRLALGGIILGLIYTGTIN